ncbi:MAG: hypothetical protein HYU27_07230 [Acidobacteria bacterium]|nr:hypothetical protein [Acidobacteriota bacterium]
MRLIGRALFVFFYIAATIAVAGERSALVVDRIGHSGGSADDRIKPPCGQSSEDLPNFGHAKKTEPKAVAEIAPESFRVPDLASREFEEQPRVEYSSSHNSEVPSCRAPPALS